jgi:hypothetical protein
MRAFSMICPVPTERISTNAAFAYSSNCSLTWPTCSTGVMTGLELTSKHDLVPISLTPWWRNRNQRAE